MDEEGLSILRNPYSGERLHLMEGKLIDLSTDQSFDIRDGIPVLFAEENLHGRNKCYRHFYDLTAFSYDFFVGLGDSLKINTEGIVRKNYIANLDISPGHKVLETAIGTGSNLAFLPDHGIYYGVDLSWQMLKRAQNKAKHTPKDITLIQGDGALLPFANNSFDLVFHMGGLQFYSDPFNGINEMARVAKPNTRIHILDEISGASRLISRIPELHNLKTIKLSPIQQMTFLVPEDMQLVSSSPIPDSDFYVLSFIKPQHF